MARLTFDHDTHTYRADGKVVPSVTQLLAPLFDFSMVREEVMALAAERGSAVHKATELFDGDDLDETSLDPRLVGYLDAWKRFRDEAKFEPFDDGIEKPLYHPIYGYAGTPDRFGTLKGEPCTLDLKTVSRLHAATAVQTAAYQQLGIKNGTPTSVRASVRLKPDGTYELKRYSSAKDWPMFLSLLTVHNWRNESGIEARAA